MLELAILPQFSMAEKASSHFRMSLSGMRSTHSGFQRTVPVLEGSGVPVPRVRVLLLLALLFASRAMLAQAGPPFQTDDAVPVPYGHYEAYIFGTVDSTPVESDPVGPAFEFNWGAVPTIQLHAILPLGASVPSSGPPKFGITDTELGVKWGIIKETKHRPQIGTFTMFEIPTGSYKNGLGIGRVWYRVPIWISKTVGPWVVDGGGGYTVVSQAGYRNFPYTSLLVSHVFNKKLQLAVESFSHGGEGPASPAFQSTSMIDAGGYYFFKTPGLQLLFAYGHSVVGGTERYGYLGLYYTWGKDKGNRSASKNMVNLRPPTGFGEGP